jgi:hypothetical protein
MTVCYEEFRRKGLKETHRALPVVQAYEAEYLG